MKNLNTYVLSIVLATSFLSPTQLDASTAAVDQLAETKQILEALPDPVTVLTELKEKMKPEYKALLDQIREIDPDATGELKAVRDRIGARMKEIRDIDREIERQIREIKAARAR